VKSSSEMVTSERSGSESYFRKLSTSDGVVGDELSQAKGGERLCGAFQSLEEAARRSGSRKTGEERQSSLQMARLEPGLSLASRVQRSSKDGVRDWRKTSSRRSIVQRNSSNSSSCSWHARRHRCKSARAGGSRPQTSAPRAARPVRRKGLVGCEAQNRDPPRSKWMPIKTGYVGQHSHTQGHRADRQLFGCRRRKEKGKKKN